MANTKNWLLLIEEAKGETITAIVVGKHYNKRWSEPPSPDENVVLSREAGLAKLDLEFDNGYGGADCYPMIAWSRSFIYVIKEYNGSTRLAVLPRHPTATEPVFL